ncbi:DegT/DnrJ/EryC1/StrS aminotransferase family protein [Alkalicaulis satelles]|uniref:DegT/DnrJ/EryC1/StrS aminotransferase family protein n=1 Tax=Alkalicaulis satelles TaxID=2609175 RepID=A0A5M6ZIW9_9PROT|nr:DegT/DnrJ/EryC1/StrS aminotransferase family protein [Alkalicaulis satelles]KAA5803637.1 DegT/DnrJ/EryC1/StrS aminotransferase family protein [Alkalicaulis satelles]
MLPFIDLAAQRARIQDRLDAAIARVVADGKYIFGPEVTELESQLKAFGQTEHALTCANGTDAIALPLMAWKLRPGDAVFAPSFTFASTAEVVAWLGATVVFVDIDPDTYCMDPASLERAIEWAKTEPGLTPRAVIAVDLFGQPADYPAISAITRAHGLKLIADSAQGFGCTLNGQHPAHWADIATISFYPAKPLGCYGDGGAVVTNDGELAVLFSSLRNHGQGEERYAYDRIGMNSRLDTIQAAILLEKLAIFPDEIKARNTAADAYAAGFGDVVKAPVVIEGGVSTWAQYTIEVDDRDAFRARLAEKGVPTAVYYPVPMHVQEPYKRYPLAPGDLPVTERAMARVVSLPMDAYLAGDRQDQVIAAVRASL